MSRIGSQTIGRAVLEPGWRWTRNVGPRAGTPWCRVHHFNYVISGRLAFATDDGETAEIGPGEVADVPPGHDAWVVGDEPCVVLDFFGNIFDIGQPMEQPRVLATILMSDIVESTATANRVGDAAWRDLLAEHDRVVRRQLDRFGGSEVKTTGDGFIATFPSAASALRCAAEMVAAVEAAGHRDPCRRPHRRDRGSARRRSGRCRARGCPSHGTRVAVRGPGFVGDQGAGRRQRSAFRESRTPRDQGLRRAGRGVRPGGLGLDEAADVFGEQVWIVRWD